MNRDRLRVNKAESRGRYFMLSVLTPSKLMEKYQPLDGWKSIENQRK